MAQQVIAVIGAGGKTTSLSLLAHQSRKENVLITTTTHMYPVAGSAIDPTPEELTEKLSGILWAGSAAKEGKLGILPPSVLEAGIHAADLVVYEGDGAKHCPLKLHKPYEPVMLPQTTHCLVVAGLLALGTPVEEAVHRYDLQWQPGQLVGVQELVHCVLETIAASGLPKEKISVFLNQADVLADIGPAIEASEILRSHGLKTKFGSLQNDASCLYDWVIEGECP